METTEPRPSDIAPPHEDGTTPVASRPGLELGLAIAATVLSLVAALLGPSPVRWAGAAAILAMLSSVVAERDATVARGRIAVIAGTLLLTVAAGGLVDPTDARSVWRPIVALAAYPFLGRALLRQVARYRMVRPTDVVVEAVLIGAAASILLQVGLEWRSVLVSGTASVEHTLPALLVGLDVALVVVVARAVSVPAMRGGSLGILGAAIVALLAGHLTAVVRLATGSPTEPAGVLIGVALVLAAGATLHGSIIRPPAVAPAEPPLFSAGHAAVVVVSVLAAPVVLSVHVVRAISVSASVAAGAAISGLVLAGHIVTLLRERADSEHQATHDALTDLPNRLLFTDRLERAIAHASRNGTPVGVLYVDLDRFKDVNDTLGHDAGDRLLETTARRLQECGRYEDTVARLAGDEFAILLPHLAQASDVLLVADRVLAALQEPVVMGPHSLRTAGSVGVAVYPYDGETPQDLLNAADAAMYQAKDGGGASVGVFSAELHQHAATRLELESSLVRAIAEDELVLYYQPIVDSRTGRTCGAEALVRWNHPERGLVPPGEFIPVAEQSDLIVELGEWVIREACHELSRWATLGCADQFVAVNVSSRHFHQDLVSTVTSALRESGVEPSQLVVELTESAAVDDLGLVADRLRELRQLGVKAAIDDFGTGYCGLQYLGDLPVSTLKLDRSFVQAMTPRSAAIVAATIAMTRSLGMTLVAEGVENADQRRFLESQGCDRMQGYHLGRPMPGDDFIDRIRAEADAPPPAPVVEEPAVPRLRAVQASGGS
jgi:diguanylate cyclase (GGDEF)-like protein